MTRCNIWICYVTLSLCEIIVDTVDFKIRTSLVFPMADIVSKMHVHVDVLNCVTLIDVVFSESHRNPPPPPNPPRVFVVLFSSSQ